MWVIATWIDWIPWPVWVAVAVLLSIALVVGLIYVYVWIGDVVIGGTLDEARDMRERLGERIARRRLRP